jgi:hypothetical protein
MGLISFESLLYQWYKYYLRIVNPVGIRIAKIKSKIKLKNKFEVNDEK